MIYVINILNRLLESSSSNSVVPTTYTGSLIYEEATKLLVCCVIHILFTTGRTIDHKAEHDQINRLHSIPKFSLPYRHQGDVYSHDKMLCKFTTSQKDRSKSDENWSQIGHQALLIQLFFFHSSYSLLEFKKESHIGNFWCIGFLSRCPSST